MASAAATAAPATRKGKDYDVTTGELRERWRKGAAELGLDRTAVRELVERPHEPPAPAKVLLDDLTRHAATFGRHDVVQAVAARMATAFAAGKGRCRRYRRRSKQDKVRYSKHLPTDRFTELAEVAADQHGHFELADSRAVGYADNTIAQMARRGRIERVSQGVYRIPFLPSGRLGPYMAAAMWPAGVRGVISRDAAMDLWEVSDVNPAKIHITVPQAHRVQREVPAAYEVHREDLAPDEATEIEGVPVVTLERAIRECAAAHMATDLLEQAIRHGREEGLLTEVVAQALTHELNVDRVAVGRA